MGKLYKRYNSKGRQQQSKSATLPSTSTTPKIEIELGDDQSEYNNSDILVLPSRKKNTDKKKVNVTSQITPKKELSKKQIKKLKKIVERKQRNIDRNALLEDLQKYRLSQEESQLLSSTTDTLTKGLKRAFPDGEDANVNQETPSVKQLINKKSKGGNSNTWSIKDDPEQIKGPNVIGLNESSSEEESEDEGAESHEEEDQEIVTPDDAQQDEGQDDNEEQSQGDEASPKSEETSKGKEPHNAITSDSSKESNMNSNKTPHATKESSSDVDKQPAIFVGVHRTPEIEEQRKSLPIVPEEYQIMEQIKAEDVVIICGETGSGKTTQVPQFLYEAGFCLNGRMIGITEPRRVAAISMSRRVGEELNLPPGHVSYQIRFEGNVTPDTKIKFLTDGVLLKEIQSDFLLSSYSAILIDEAHERSLYSDILIGLLSRIVPLRRKKGNPLKFIIMSATLRVKDFTENSKLFKTPPPVIEVQSRQFPVSIHFNKKTPTDYLDEAFKKACKIHATMPAGGILIFVTGQQEVHTLCKKLRNRFAPSKESHVDGDQDESRDKKRITSQEGSKQDANVTPSQRKPKVLSDLLPKISLDDFNIEKLETINHKSNDEADVDDENDLEDLKADDGTLSSDDEDDSMLMKKMMAKPHQPMYCLPLYSMLPPEKQRLVFKPPPKGTRLCVVATNVAETSVTIPDIKYVIDTGKVKQRVWDKVTGISAFVVDWTSKASANQRAGRAGRTSPGHVYRLYSSAVFNDSFLEFAEPEIVKKPIEDLVLQMKGMNIDNVAGFPFPTAPSREAIEAAEQKLVLLDALESLTLNLPTLRLKKKQQPKVKTIITELGKVMSYFPISPRYAKMLCLSHQYSLVPYVIALVSAITVQEIFIDSSMQVNDQPQKEEQKEKHKKWMALRKKWSGLGHSHMMGDFMVMLKAVGASEYAGCTPSFCMQNGLRPKAMTEIHKLRKQLTNHMNELFPHLQLDVDPNMIPPSDIQAKLMRQILLTSLLDHVARKIPDGEIAETDKKRLRNAYRSIETEDPVFISPQSVLNHDNLEYVVYLEIFETGKLYMRGVAAIEAEWLPLYAKKQCTFSKPLEDPLPFYDPFEDCVKCHCRSTFGPYCWPLPAVEVEYPDGADRYRWFAKELLEGNVFPLFKEYSKVLLSPASIMVKSWAKLQKRCDLFLGALVMNKACSRSSLVQLWSQSPKFLLTEYLSWLPEAIHHDVTARWPPTKSTISKSS